MNHPTRQSTKSYPVQAVIAEEDSESAGWYVLLEGKVGVFKKDTQVAEFATRGMIFGEIGSILGRKRTARLIALEPTRVVHFEATVDELIAHHPQVAKTVLVSLAQRLERTTDALWTALHTPKFEEPGPT